MSNNKYFNIIDRIKVVTKTGLTVLLEIYELYAAQNMLFIEARISDMNDEFCIPVGSLTFNYNHLFYNKLESYSWLNLFSVDKDYLGQGIGHELIACYENYLFFHGVTDISGDCQPFGAGSNRTDRFYTDRKYVLLDGFLYKQLSNDNICELHLDKGQRFNPPLPTDFSCLDDGYCDEAYGDD